MILINKTFNMESFMSPILDTLIMIFCMLVMMYMYAKYRIFPLILLTLLVSIIIGVASIQLNYNPFTPYFQVFFICFQLVFFIKTATQYIDHVKQKE
jgi:uncharacterized membrane protein YcaP (DUF421 family)